MGDNTLLGKNIQPLKGQTTYRIWSVQIKSILASKGLWNYVTGKIEEPVKDDDTESQKDFNARLKEYEIDSAKAAGILQQSLSKDIILDVEYLEDPAEIWSHLKGKYEPSGLAYQFSIYQEWQSIQYDGKGLEEFTLKYQQACTRLKESKLDVSETIKLYQFITLISPWFETFTANLRERLRNIKADDATSLPKLNDIISSLLDEAKAQKHNQAAAANFTRSHSGSGSKGYQNPSKPKTKGSGNNSRSNSNHECSHCGSKHIEAECWHLHPEKAPKRYRPPPCNKTGCNFKKRFKDSEFKISEGEENLPNRGLFASGTLDEDCFSTMAVSTQPAPTISEAAVQAMKASKSSHSWILDSGASAHFTHELDKMVEYQLCDVLVQFGKGTARASAYGSIILDLVGKHVRRVKISDVYFVKDICANLLSTEKLRSKGLFYRNDKQILFTKDDTVMANVYPYQGVPHVQIGEQQVSALASSHHLPTSKATADVWHARFGHIHQLKLEKALKVCRGIKIAGRHELCTCHTCKKATAKRMISRVTGPRTERPLTHWNVDVVTMTPRGVGSERYFTLMTCASSLKHQVGFHPTKDGAYQHVVNLINYVNTQTDETVQQIHIDGGREFGGEKMTSLCEEKGIRLVITTPYNSEQNGRAEVSNHLVCTVARKLMIHGKVPKGLWPEAISAAVYIIDMMPSDTLGGISPYQKVAEHLGWTPKKPYVGNLKVYGCKAFVLDHDVKRSDKMASRAVVGKLVGYEGHNIYRIWIPNEHKTIRSTNVTFDEACLDAEGHEDELIDLLLPDDAPRGGVKQGGADAAPTAEADGPNNESSVAASGGEGNGEAETEATQSDDDEFHTPGDFGHAEDDDYQTDVPALGNAGPLAIPPPPLTQGDTALRRSDRTKKSSQAAKDSKAYQDLVNEGLTRRHKLYTILHDEGAARKKKTTLPRAMPFRAFTAFTKSVDVNEVKTPNTIDEALTTPQREQWLDAMKAELKSIKDNRVWRLKNKLAIAEGKRVLKGRWVYKLKLGADGSPVKFKARWVVKGFTQRQGHDFDETYAAVTKATTLKLIMSLIAHYDLEAKQYDIMTAFLNAVLRDHEIYVEQPHGFEEGGSDFVCQLDKALYGLKQAPRLWYEELTKFLENKGYQPLRQDPCVFQHKMNKVIIMVYVDDMIAAACSAKAIENSAAEISSNFKMHSLGDISFYLGCRILRDRTRKKLWLVQDAYIQQLLVKHHMEDATTAVTPMDPNNRLCKAPEDYQADGNLLSEYQTLVGGLMWPALQTRPDIAYATSVLARYMNNPTQNHLDAAKRVLRYLKGKPNHGIVFKSDGTSVPTIEGYTDSSYADDKDTAKSTGAYLFKCAGGLISWKSGRQPTISLSSTEAEYVAAALAAREAAYIAILTDELTLFTHEARPITMNVDNESAISLGNKPIVDGRTKHIHVKYHYLRDQVESGDLKLNWVSTDDQAADILTKPHFERRHQHYCDLIGLTDCSDLIKAADDSAG